ncbi:MAG: ribonuclease P protein component [Flavobacteriaceae bacterium]|nr:ribonuclease P protein component [Flavobacteriaceae bacterium]
MGLTFSKAERLKSKKLIEQLISEGKSVKNFPVKLHFLPVDFLENSQVAFSVPKRNFKLAVDRNRIKRQLRESYRLHKDSLNSNNGKNFALLFVYIGKKQPQYAELESSVKALLKKINS